MLRTGVSSRGLTLLMGSCGLALALVASAAWAQNGRPVAGSAEALSSYTFGLRHQSASEAMARGRFAMEITGTTSTGASYRTTVAAPYDPGYSGTAIMLGQSALALVSDSASLPDRSGVLTPATAIGMPLVERLRRHQFTFATKRTT